MGEKKKKVRREVEKKKNISPVYSERSKGVVIIVILRVRAERKRGGVYMLYDLNVMVIQFQLAERRQRSRTALEEKGRKKGKRRVIS